MGRNGKKPATQKYLIRESSVELLKVLAIILIVFSHTAQTYIGDLNNSVYNGTGIDILSPTLNAQYIIVQILRTGGLIGNCFFFACSAWYLSEKQKTGKKKALDIVLQIWFISVIILVIHLFIDSKGITESQVTFSLFPVTKSAYWYLTFYVVFYLICPYINRMLMSMSREQMLSLTLVLFFIYVLVHFLDSHILYSNDFTFFLTLYVMVVYVKKFMVGFQQSRKKNIILLLVGIAGHCLGMLATDFAGVNNPDLMLNISMWVFNYSPFAIIIAIAAQNLAQQIHFKNGLINYLSSLSLLVYVIHENTILRITVRRAIVHSINTTYGPYNGFFWILPVAVGTIVVSFVAAVIYKYTINKGVLYLSDKLYMIISKMYRTLISSLSKID